MEEVYRIPFWTFSCTHIDFACASLASVGLGRDAEKYSFMLAQHFLTSQIGSALSQGLAPHASL